MLDKTQLNKSDILLLKHADNSCSLRFYLNFLQSLKVKRPYRFSHIQSQATLIEYLSLKQNIQLDTLMPSFESDKDYELQKLIKNCSNPYLEKILENIGHLDQFPKQIDPEKRKLVSFAKSLLQQSDYLFIDRPENDLCENYLSLIMDAIKYQAHKNGQIIIISSNKQEYWEQYVTKVIERDEKKKFLVTSPVAKIIKIDDFRDSQVATIEKKSA